MSVLYYLDSSVWVKRYFSEPGSAWVQRFFAREAPLACNALGYVEVAAALARRTKVDVSLSPLKDQLRTEWNQMLQVDLTSSVYERALILAWEQKLRGGDALHLSSARQLKDEAEQRSVDFIMLSSDAELVRASKRLGITVINPAELT